jgi:hypothetical protein
MELKAQLAKAVQARKELEAREAQSVAQRAHAHAKAIRHQENLTRYQQQKIGAYGYGAMPSGLLEEQQQSTGVLCASAGSLTEGAVGGRPDPSFGAEMVTGARWHGGELTKEVKRGTGARNLDAMDEGGAGWIVASCGASIEGVISRGAWQGGESILSGGGSALKATLKDRAELGMMAGAERATAGTKSSTVRSGPRGTGPRGAPR